ncbi:MAG: RDD family protein [Pseudomonadota bacterium]
MQPASFLRRLLAMFYDSLLVAALLLAASALVVALRKGEAVEPGSLWFGLYLLGVVYLFFGWCWTRGGQTLGLKTWKLQVVDFNGRPVTWRLAALRYLGAILSWLCLGLGFFWILVDKDKLAWHDRLSKTKVIRVRPQ